MSTFELEKRDPFITEEGANAKLQKLQRGLTGISRQRMNDLTVDEDQRYKDSLFITQDTLEYLLLNYTMGTPLSELIPLAKNAFIEQDRHNQGAYANREDTKLNLWETNGYMYATWLMGAAVLLNQLEYLPKFPSWIQKNPKYGDTLIAALFQRMGVVGVNAGKGLQYPKAYGGLLNIVNASIEDINAGKREQWMTEHLKGWYKNMMKHTVWGDWHEPEQANIYFGHWSFESGVMTLLYGLDDSSYRDMTFYPKDLVDWARQNVNLSSLQPTTTAQPKTRYSGYQVAVGEICQETGYYECPRLQGKTVMLMQGQPVAGDKFNEIGAIIWYKLSKEAERDYLDNRKKNPITGEWS